MNFFGKLLVRLNWLYKYKVLSGASSFVFVSPSQWLSSRYNLLSIKMSSNNNSASELGLNLISSLKEIS